MAKQPIFNLNEELFGYELLYRSNHAHNFFTGVNGDQATSDVIINSFLNIGMDKLSEGKPCFVNFTENLLKLGLPTYFDPSTLVVEILEDVKPTGEILDICRQLKDQGYRIALDDFYMEGDDLNTLKLLAYVDIVKIDILNTPRDKWVRLLQKLKGTHLKFLAEKVETREEFEQCVLDGYTYFQGYFFSKPTILKSFDVPHYFTQYYQIIGELSQIEPDIDKLASAIEKDLSLSYKLLKLIKSPSIRPVSTVSTIKQTVLLLGLNEIRRWIYVIAVRDSIYQNTRPSVNEVIKLCFTRAKMGELLAEYRRERANKSSFFLLGMLSSIDCLLDCPLQDIMKELPLKHEIKAALLHEETNLYSETLELIHALERDDWTNLSALCVSMELEVQKVTELFRQAMDWSMDYLMDLQKVT